MKFVTILIALILVAGLGGFAWLAFTDIPVPQKDVVKEIPYEPVSTSP
jgi:hypothetical protein